jgi:GT2 family glycosyltransferase
MRLEAIQTIGMFSPYFFAYHEDVELALRCRLFGYEVLCAPSAMVFHSRGGAGAGNRFRDFMGTRNLVLTLLKIYDRETWRENSAALMGHFAAPADGQRFQAALAAFFDAPAALRDRRRLRRKALRRYSDILDDLASIS